MKNVAYMILNSYGFKKYKTKYSNIVYFCYKDDKNKETTMFIHGLGFGITPYLSHILALRENTNLIVPVLPNISNMEYNTNFKSFEDEDLFPNYKNWRKDVKRLIHDHEITELNVIAHSFGTIILGLLLKDKFLDSVIKKRIFVDPVCFMEDCYKIYRYINEPDFGKESVVNDVFNTIIYRDVYLRYVSQRFLFGPEYWITDYDNLSNHNNLVILSFNDQMLPIITLYNKMLKHKIPCLLIDRAYHADIFMTDEFKVVVDYMKEHILEK